MFQTWALVTSLHNKAHWKYYVTARMVVSGALRSVVGRTLCTGSNRRKAVVVITSWCLQTAGEYIHPLHWKCGLVVYHQKTSSHTEGRTTTMWNVIFTAFSDFFIITIRARYSKHLNRVLRRELNKSHLREIRLLKRCKTTNLSRVSRQALWPDLRRDSDSLSYIVWVTGFQV